MPKDDASSFAVPSHVRVSTHAGGLVLLHGKTGRVFTAKRIGAEIWKSILEGGDCSDDDARLSLKYQVPQERVMQDRERFVEELLALGFLSKRVVSLPVRRCKILWVTWALWQLIYYDLVYTTGGLNAVRRDIQRVKARGYPVRPGAKDAVFWAMSWAEVLYFRRVRCLLRSMATAALLRRNGVDAEVVIGYQTNPFVGHSWIEIGGHAVNDSRVFHERFHVLDRV